MMHGGANSHLEHGDKLISHIAAGELEFIHTPFHCSLRCDCIVATMLATTYNVMHDQNLYTTVSVNRNIVYRDCVWSWMCALGSFLLFSAVKPVHAQADSMMSPLYLVTIPKPGFKIWWSTKYKYAQHTTILMNCRPLVYVHWKEKQHNWVKKEKKLRECVTAAQRTACWSGVAAAVRWDSGWNNILLDQI